MKPLKIIILLLLMVFMFAGCTHMRTEFYREETKHLYETGCQLYKQGDYENAQLAFEEAVSLDPDYGPAHAALGNIAMISEEYEDAYAHYQSAVKHDPELKKELLPFLMISDMHKSREPLTRVGIELSDIYPLLMEDKNDELETIFKKDIPLELLAKDTVSLTPGQIGELQFKTSGIAPQVTGSVPFRLFLAYLLFYSGQYESENLKLLNSLAQDATGVFSQDTFVLQGRLKERVGDNSGAVDSFVAATDAGKPLAEVAHHLARLYQVDIKTIIPPVEEQKTIPEDKHTGSTPFPTSTVVSEDIEQQEIKLEQAVIVVPKPQAKLISTPE